MVELKFYKVTGINFSNRLQNGTELKLSNQAKYNISYFGEEKRCLGKLDFRVSDESMKPFEIRVEMEAVFTYEDGDEQPDIHVSSFDQLFPFLRQIIHETTAMSGMPGLMIPLMKLDRNSVSTQNNEAPAEPLN
ncbi:MAG: hypothetical protein K6C14_05215 [Eubacterium sp.]|nr:hypothetical protein [Eubacterium sp.]